MPVLYINDEDARVQLWRLRPEIHAVLQGEVTLIPSRVVPRGQVLLLEDLAGSQFFFNLNRILDPIPMQPADEFRTIWETPPLSRTDRILDSAPFPGTEPKPQRTLSDLLTEGDLD